MLRKNAEESDAFVSKDSASDEDIATSPSTFQDRSLNYVLSTQPIEGNSLEISHEICCISDNSVRMSQGVVAADAADPMPVQEEAIYLGRPRVISNVSDNPFETVREMFLVQGDIAESPVEICESQDELQCDASAPDELQVGVFESSQASNAEHDYVRNSDNSSATMCKNSDTGSIVVKKIVLPLRTELSYRPVWPLLSSAMVPSDGPPAKKCRFSTSGSMSSDSSVSDVGADKPSVLRTLLQASDNQLIYQRHKHASEWPHLPRTAIATNKTHDSASLKVRKKDFGCQAGMTVGASRATWGEGSHLMGVRENEQLQSAVENHSQIKALLLGQSYDRQSQSDNQARAWDGGSQANQQCYDRRCMRVQEHELPSFLCDVVDVVSEYKDLSYSVQSGQNKARSIEVRRKGLYGVPYPGMTPAQVMIEEAGTAHFFTLVKLVFSVACKDEDGQLTPDPLLQLLHKLSIRGGHVFCPGVESELAQVAPNTKNLTTYELLEPRYQSHDCPVWHMLGTNQSWFPLNEGVYKCKPCKSLERYLRTLGKAKERKEVMTFS